jgi:hypothetical protein
MALKRHFELEPGAIPTFNRRAESVQWAAERILGVSVPLVVFDPSLQVPAENQLIEGFREQTLFGPAMTPQLIKIHPRELKTLGDETLKQLPDDLPDNELLKRVDSRLWEFLILTTIEGPGQGREDLKDIVHKIFPAALNDWASKEYGVTLPQKKP